MGDNQVKADSVDAALLSIRARLSAELSHPSDESVVRVAAAHNELRRLSISIPSQTQIDCLLDIAQYFYVSGQTALGLEPASKAVAAARALKHEQLLRKALTFHGILLADTGNLPSAVECYASALELASRTKDQIGEAVVWTNLGAALLYAAQYSDSTKCLRRALELDNGDKGFATLRPTILSNIALACLFAEEFQAGIASAEEAIASLDRPGTANELLSRVNAESHYSRLLLEVGHIDAARARCEAAKLFAQQSHSQRAQQAAAIAEGLYEVHSGKIDIGLSRLQGALQQARVLKFSLRDALIAMVKAHDLAGKPQLALIHLRELLNVTKRTQQERALVHHRMHLETLGLDVEPTATAFPLERRMEFQRDRVKTTLALLHRQSIAAELIEDPTGEHIFRVGKLSALLGAELGLDDDTCFMLEMSARLHDIGKIGIPEAIIAKRGKINPDQRALVQTHANIGAELLSQSGLPHIQMAVDVARHHHEKWDGSGYPDGLAMEAIPEVARIVALADSFDAMTHDRPYRPALSSETALSEIEAAAGTKFDPGMTETFVELVRKLKTEHPDLDAFLGAEAQESPFIRARKKIAEALQQAKDSGGQGGL
jgi:putative two-component system response regulator